MRKILFIVAIVAVITAVCGCTCCNFSTGTQKETFSLNGNTYQYYDISLTKGGTLTYGVTSSNPVDVIIMDESNYKDFTEDVTAGAAEQEVDEVTTASDTFKAPSDGTYYFIVYNYGSSATSVSVDLKW